MFFSFYNCFQWSFRFHIKAEKCQANESKYMVGNPRLDTDLPFPGIEIQSKHAGVTSTYVSYGISDSYQSPAQGEIFQPTAVCGFTALQCTFHNIRNSTELSFSGHLSYISECGC
jgi:hypothetical protein